jgi:hypothetical protein
MKRIKERLRDIVAVVKLRILLLYCPAFVNRVYNGLAYKPLNWLVQHGFLADPVARSLGESSWQTPASFA